jgi:integration host factor subunit beta
VIKSELVDRISIQNPHLYRQHAEKIANTILSEITTAMARGDRVELRGVGAFFVKFREGRTGRNPRTGVPVSVGRKAVPFFRTGKGMKSRLNSNADGAEIDAGQLAQRLSEHFLGGRGSPRISKPSPLETASDGGSLAFYTLCRLVWPGWSRKSRIECLKFLRCERE